MFKFILIVLALALFGANSLFKSATESIAPAPPFENGAIMAPPTYERTDSSFMSNMAGLALNAATSVSGFSLQPLPDVGCSESAVSVDKLNDFLATLPEPQRTTLAKVLTSSSTVWSAQLYKGSAGVGLCMPAHDKVVILPGLSEESMSVLGSMLPEGVQ